MLRATIDWSYNLLSPDEQSLLRRMGVFAGGFTLHAAQTFCEIENDIGTSAEDVLAALIAKNLLMRDEQPDGSSRYRMLETIREYALDKLAERGEKNVWQRRHAEYFVAVFEITQRSTPEERVNWQAAFEWTQSAPDAGGLGLSLASFGLRTGNVLHGAREAASWLVKALAHPEAEHYPVARAFTLVGLGTALQILSDFTRARIILEQCLVLCRTCELWFVLPLVYDPLSIVARELGDFQAARTYLKECDYGSREYDHRGQICWNYCALAEVAIAEEDVLEAERLLNQSSALSVHLTGFNFIFNQGWV